MQLLFQERSSLQPLEICILICEIQQQRQQNTHLTNSPRKQRDSSPQKTLEVKLRKLRNPTASEKGEISFSFW